MKTLYTILLVFLCGLAHAQYPSIQWARSIGGSGLEEGAVVKPTADGGLILICMSASADGDFPTNKGLLDCWVVKMTSWGDIVWKKDFGGSADDVPTDISQTSDGGYVFTCYSKSADGDVTLNHGNNDYWVVKIDDTGRIQWQKSYGGSGNDVAMSVHQTTDGGYIVGGYSESTDGDVTGNHGMADYWVIKLSSTGSLVWQKTFGGSADDMLASIQQTADGGYIISGESSSNDGDVTGNHGGDDFWVVKLSSAGSLLWERSYGGSADDDAGDDAYPGAIEQTFDHGYIISGETSSSDGDVTGFHGGTLYDAWIVKLDSVGGLQWEKTLGGTNDDDGFYIRQTPDSGYVAACSAASGDGDVTNKYGGFDYWIVRLTPAGTIQWQHNYGGTGVDIPYSVYPLSDSVFIATGYSNSTDSQVTGNHGDYDAWTVKFAWCSLPVINAVTGPAGVCAGSSIQLTDDTSGGTWSVSNADATVSASGSVTGITPGSAAVFYTKANSCGTGGATQIITVFALPIPVIATSITTVSVPGYYSSYQWTFNGTSITGAISDTCPAIANGIYAVTVTDTNGCTGTSANDTVIREGISNVGGRMNCYLAPNPTTGTVSIYGAGNGTIEVYNMVGQLVKKAANASAISIAGYPPGLYLFRIYDSIGNLVKQEKILKA